MLAVPTRYFALPASVLALATGLLASPVSAQAERDVDEIARQMSNPTLPMMNITNLIDFQTYRGDLPGASDQSSWTYLLQPPLPFPITETKNLIFRPAIPILFNQPVFREDGFESAGLNLGDVSFDLLYGGTNQNGVLSGFGIVGNLPVSTDSDLRGEWAIGPEAVVGLMRPWGVLLLLVTQKWELSGDEKTSTLGGQYAVAFSLPGGWQLVSSPPFSYNWTSKDLTLPLGGGPMRTIILGSTPVKLGFQAYYYVARPDAFGPEWLFRFQVQPSVRRPW